ncbi:MAG: molybdopterin-dependent oxidoreductase [Alphaproteobacteria bacterium]|nr:molybdopterin-dependent oxidoreductase [Alphaproteobacteria bacterium]
MSGWKVFGSRAKRLEDPALLTGQGRFVDDIILPEMLHAAFVRSPHGHAKISRIDVEQAQTMDGVQAVYTLNDFRPHLTNEHLVVGLPSPAYKQELDRPALANDEVVYVGKPVAIVVADTRYIAEDAAAMVMVDYDILPAVADCRAALEDGAPLAHSTSPHNILAQFDMGYGEVDSVFANAPHVYSESMWQHRGGSQSIECRGAVSFYDPIEDLVTLYSATQAAHTAKNILIDMLGLDENQIRVIIPDVGGGFGPKLVFYQEDVAVVLAAKLLGRPVKWAEDRREHFISTTQERDQFWDVEIAVDNDGKILGLRGSMIHDHGAYTARGINLAFNSALIVSLPYDVPCYYMDVVLAVTNKVPVTPVRGAGHPQGIFVMERLLDRAARELGIDRPEIRRRNLIPTEQLPYTKGLKTRGDAPVILDSGDYLACMEDALERIDFTGFLERQKKALQEGRYIGVGVANYVKGTGRGPFETVTVRIGPSGKIMVYSGAAAMGQSTQTMLTQIVAEHLGGDMENVEVVIGDSSVVPMGIGGSASRQTVTAGSSALLAAREVQDKALKVAAHMLEASEEDLEIDGNEIRVKGVPDLKVGLGKVAHAVAGTPGYALPGGIEPGMEATKNFMVDDLTFVNGTAAVEVEVDPETGKVSFLKYVIVHDCGTVVNPMIVEGQVIGGTAHGIGNTLFEWMGYDETAQPITTNFAEYLLVSAPEMPHIQMGHMESPTPLNPLGVKGVGECGVVPAPAAIISAVENALSPFGVFFDHVPLRPPEIVEKIQSAKALAG